MILTPQLFAPTLIGLFQGHAYKVKMQDSTSSYFWWPDMIRQFQIIATNCEERIKTKKQCVFAEYRRNQFRTTVRVNQEIYLDSLGPLPYPGVHLNIS